MATDLFRISQIMGGDIELHRLYVSDVKRVFRPARHQTYQLSSSQSAQSAE